MKDNGTERKRQIKTRLWNAYKLDYETVCSYILEPSEEKYKLLEKAGNSDKNKSIDSKQHISENL